MQALHKVEELDPKDPRIVPVKANPCSLRCHICKAFAMLGICHHILVVTDLIMQTRPESERLVECDVQKALMLVDKNKTKDSLSGAVNKKGAKALEKKAPAQRGKYSSKKNEARAARARTAKAVKDRAATATKVIGVRKKKAAPRPAGATAAARKKQIDSSDEEEKEEEEDSSDED